MLKQHNDSARASSFGRGRFYLAAIGNSNCFTSKSQPHQQGDNHILNRANGRLRLFKKDADFAACEQVLEEPVSARR